MKHGIWAEKGLQVAKSGRIEIREYYRMTGKGGWCLELAYLCDSDESQEDVDRFSCGRDGMYYGWRRGWGVSERSQA